MGSQRRLRRIPDHASLQPICYCPPPPCHIEGALNTVCPVGTEIPLAGNTATSGNYANSGECWDYFASWSVGNEGPVTVSDYGTGYPKGCWRQGNYRYFNTGAGGAQPASIPICRGSIGKGGRRGN